MITLKRYLFEYKLVHFRLLKTHYYISETERKQLKYKDLTGQMQCRHWDGLHLPHVVSVYKGISGFKTIKIHQTR